ncbi:MAG: nickel pincer cofactor biosynthesis protein LarC [Thermodesulfobacteriota bacterium]
MTAAAYFDCPAGAAGDMILAAFLDAGLPLEYLRENLARLDLSGYALESRTVLKQGLAARTFEARIEPQEQHRPYSEVRRLIRDSGLDEAVKDLALAVFEKLALVEARVHGVDPEEVHFHELGAVDSILDVAGAALAWTYFRIEEATASPLPLGSGFIDTAHGRLPLPAPATLALLENTPTYGAGIEAELVTPTGAALLTTLATRFGPRPAMVIGQTGIGAGRRDLPDRPNILRLTLGRVEDRPALERLMIGETNIDDMNPEIFPFVLDRLLAAGALDVWLTSIHMKKGRPGAMLSFLCRPGDAEALAGTVLRETTTLGVRTYEAWRRALPRQVRMVQTPWGEAAVKDAERGGGTETIPEYESCRRIAIETGRPLKEIYEEIVALARK